jgi:hypothetical protein
MLPEKAKQPPWVRRVAPILSALAKLLLLPATKRLVLQETCSGLAWRRLVLLAEVLREMFPEVQRQPEKGRLVLPVRARRYLRDPGPCAFCREALAVQKCNRAARCGGYPIRARCPHRRNQSEPARYGNSCSRSPRKLVLRV